MKKNQTTRTGGGDGLALVVLGLALLGCVAAPHVSVSPLDAEHRVLSAEPGIEQKEEPMAKESGSVFPSWNAEASLVADGLASPDGLAAHPGSGDLYVSEEDAARILRIRRDGTHVPVADSRTPVYAARDGTQAPTEPIRSPEGLAFGPDRTLYVVEDLPGGRLIALHLDADGAAVSGTVVDIPLGSHRYAWESVAVHSDGAILLAGSSAEYETSAEGPGLFEGVLLYRDAAGKWWMPIKRFMASFSAACFSRDGNTAFFACEFGGEVGWLDLRSTAVRVGCSQRRFKSPEGLCVLPDDTLLVVEERGRIIQLDPVSDHLRILAESFGASESACWDAERQRVLISADQSGRVLAHTPMSALNTPECPPAGLHFADCDSRRHVPETCPSYLENVLRRGGYDPADGRVDFATFAKRVSLLAVNAKATLISSDADVRDPIDHVQLAVFAPYLFGFDMGALQTPVSGFAAHHASGELVTTRLVERSVISADLILGVAEAMGNAKVTVPFPSGARTAAGGVASIHFMGLGQTPDYSIVVNPRRPKESYLFVLRPDGGSEQYRLELPPGRDATEWVVALRGRGPDQWAALSGDTSETRLAINGSPARIGGVL